MKYLIVVNVVYILIFYNLAYCENAGNNLKSQYLYYNPYGKYFSNSQPMFTDRYRNWNRVVFNMNYKIDKKIILFGIEDYQSSSPRWPKLIIKNMSRNLFEPVNMVNYLLQGNVNGFFKSFWRFALNSTIGMAGAFDIGESFDMAYDDNGFDRTMHFYGFSAGDYIILPWYGSHSYRSLIANFMNFLFNPLLYIIPTNLINLYWFFYSSLLKSNSLLIGAHLSSGSLDPYETWKRVFFQHQQYNFN